MAVEGLVEQFGMFGLLLALLGHLAYQWYRDHYGAVREIRQRIDGAHKRLDGVGAVLYRKAREDWSDIDEDELRDMLFDGDQVVFPRDFDEDGYFDRRRNGDYLSRRGDD